MSIISRDSLSPYSQKLQVHPAESEDKSEVARKSESELRSLAEAASDWYQGTAKGTFFVGKITCEDLLSLESILIEKEIKLRLEWSSKSFIARLSMSTEVHENPGAWLAELPTVITDWLMPIAICGRPYVKMSGSVGLKLPSDMRLPDQTVYLYYKEDGERNSRVKDQDGGEGQDEDEIPERFKMPRIVLETAYSQSYELVKRKAWRYLYETGRAIHAVIIVFMTYPVTLKHNFRAEIGVWVRDDTGKADEDFPLEPCVCRGTSSEHKVRGDSPTGDDESVGPGSVISAESHPALVTDQTSGSDESSLASQPEPLGRFRPSENDPDMILRSGKPILFYDEASLSERANFVRLNAYDFLRLCEEQPDAYIEPANLDLDLRPLKEAITRSLLVMRGEIKARSKAAKAKKAEPKVAEPKTAEPDINRAYPPPWLLEKRRAASDIAPPAHRVRRDA